MTTALERTLRREVRGEVWFDPARRAMYGRDASICEVLPLGVVCPLDADDAQVALQVAGDLGAAVLPRGGGTSLAGQTVASALVFDFTRHMHRVLGVDTEHGLARVQPGLVLEALNRAVTPAGLMFGPDVATASRASLGGMIGNNSCGAHSLVYGRTADHLEAARVLLADGTCMDLGGGSSADPDLARALAMVGERFAPAVRTDLPTHPRRVMGYDLTALAGPDPLRLIAGSEGTLAVVLEARLRLVERPAHTQLVVASCADVFEGAALAPMLLDTPAVALELLDAALVALARSAPGYEAAAALLPPAGAWVVAEYAGGALGEVAGGVAAARRRLAAAGISHQLLVAPAAQAAFWRLRRAGLALVMRRGGRRRPLGFVEDAAVAPVRLAEYLRRVDAIVRAHGTDAHYYGHAGAGCVHVRPLIDLGDVADRHALVAIAEAVAVAVKDFGGVLSGEHGDGLLRSPFMEPMLGSEAAAAMIAVKQVFDPNQRLNPGKIVGAGPLIDSLRWPLDTARTEPVLTPLIEACNGNGLCRALEGGSMCPTYRVTRDEADSPRGRARALSALVGTDRQGPAAVEAVGRALDGCLGCRACKRECPTAVDVARLKSEFLARRRSSWSQLVFGEAHRGIAWSARWPSAWRRQLGRPWARRVLGRLAGADGRRLVPALREVPWRRTWADARQPTVVLWDDTWTAAFEPGLGEAALAVLSAGGERPKLPDQPVCCGRALLSAGRISRARQVMRRLVEVVYPDVERGLPLVGIEPSCVYTLRDELPAFLPGDGRAFAVAAATRMWDEVVRAEALDAPAPPAPVRLVVHAHCHRRAGGDGEAMAAWLGQLPGVQLVPSPPECCGMAGAFGYLHHRLSMAVGELGLFPAVRRAGPGAVVVAEGFSCRQQLRDGLAIVPEAPLTFAARHLGLVDPGRRVS